MIEGGLWMFRLRIERTSDVNRSASRKGNKLRRQVSVGSQNQLFIGIALSGYCRYAGGELSRMKIDERSLCIADKSFV